MTVVIADDHGVWRQGLRSLLEPVFDVVAEANDGQGAVDKTLALRPDAVVLDIWMPGMDGLTAARRIRETLPDVRIVILSAAATDQMAADAIQVGADAYLTKDNAPEVIVEAIRGVASGVKCSSSLPRDRMRLKCSAAEQRSRKGATAASLELSQRELAVLRLMLQGHRYKEIAGELKISPRTVGNYAASIYNKLGVNDRADAVVWAVKRGIIRI